MYKSKRCGEPGELSVLDWNDLRYFLAVARSHSLTEAGRELGTSPATVARRIAALEHALGAGLFAKSNDGYLLTAQGEALTGPAEQAEAHLLWLERSGAVPSDALSGVVRIAMPELLGQHFIIPSLAEFGQKYPHIGVEAVADVRPLTLKEREADLLVRLVRPANGDYTVRKIGGISLCLYGSQRYVSTHGTPRTFTDLAGHRLIGWEARMNFLPFSRWLGDAVPTQNLVFRAHTMTAQLSAVDAGIGLAVLPAFVARKYGLVRVVEDEAPFRSDIWLLQASDAQSFARVRVLADHLTELFAHATDSLVQID